MDGASRGFGVKCLFTHYSHGCDEEVILLIFLAKTASKLLFFEGNLLKLRLYFDIKCLSYQSFSYIAKSNFYTFSENSCCAILALEKCRQVSVVLEKKTFLAFA